MSTYSWAAARAPSGAPSVNANDADNIINAAKNADIASPHSLPLAEVGGQRLVVRRVGPQQIVVYLVVAARPVDAVDPVRIELRWTALRMELQRLPERRLGIALKVEDGHALSAMIALVSLLDQVGFDPAPSAVVPQFARYPVKNTRGQPVGALEPCGELEFE